MIDSVPAVHEHVLVTGDETTDCVSYSEQRDGVLGYTVIRPVSQLYLGHHSLNTALTHLHTVQHSTRTSQYKYNTVQVQHSTTQYKYKYSRVHQSTVQYSNVHDDVQDRSSFKCTNSKSLQMYERSPRPKELIQLLLLGRIAVLRECGLLLETE